jgi:hypothetical protein
VSGLSPIVSADDLLGDDYTSFIVLFRRRSSLMYH